MWTAEQPSSARGFHKHTPGPPSGNPTPRRIVPGEHLAVDPKGRACLIGALEKQKFVYVLNRDNEARLTISSPLEAHRGQTLVYSVVGLDMGFDNPIFAAIELDYTDVDQVWGMGAGVEGAQGWGVRSRGEGSCCHGA